MEDIMETYGECLLQMAGGAGALALYVALLQQGSVLCDILQQYMMGICG